MSVATQSGIPESFTAGDTVIFPMATEAAYPVEAWSATIVFSRDGIPMMSKAATVSGSGFLFTLTRDNTRALPAGIYDVAVYVSDDTERATLGSRSAYDCGCCSWPYSSPPWTVRVLPNLEDERPATWVEKALAKCEESIAALTESIYTSTSFSGQSQTTMRLQEKLTDRAHLQALVNAERARLAGGRDINIRPVFT